MFECFHFLQRTVVWPCDFDFSDFGLDGDGIVQVLHCTNCGAEIEYRIPIKGDTEDDGDNV